MKKKKLTSRAVNSFSVSFAQRKPFDLPPRPHYCSATTFAVCIEAIWIGFAVQS